MGLFFVREFFSKWHKSTIENGSSYKCIHATSPMEAVYVYELHKQREFGYHKDCWEVFEVDTQTTHMFRVRIIKKETKVVKMRDIQKYSKV